MKILHLITRLIVGGAQENTVLSCEGQAAEGHDVTLAYGPIYGPEGSLHERARRGGYRLVELSALTRAVRPITDARGYRQCRALIRELRPDVVHTHSSKAGIVGRAAAWAQRVPAVVHTVHGLAFHPYGSRLNNAIYVRAERWAAKRCHAIVCVADAMTKQALAAGVGRPEQYSTIYSGMEVEPFLRAGERRAATRAALGIGERDIVIGTLARLAELKGHDDLLDALGKWLLRRSRVKMLWVGDGFWRRRLEQRIIDERLTEKVLLTGMAPSQRVPDLLGAMDVLVHPSYREGLARALPQALLSGVPVVSYDCDGAGEVCVDQVTGRLIATGDKDWLGGAVRWLVGHPDDRRRLAAEGRARCIERFDHRVMVRELLTLYEKLLAERGAI